MNLKLILSLMLTFAFIPIFCMEKKEEGNISEETKQYIELIEVNKKIKSDEVRSLLDLPPELQLMILLEALEQTALSADKEIFEGLDLWQASAKVKNPYRIATTLGLTCKNFQALKPWLDRKAKRYVTAHRYLLAQTYAAEKINLDQESKNRSLLELLESNFDLAYDLPIAKLIIAGANTNFSGEIYMPLHKAIYDGNARIVKLLLDYDANPDLFDQYNQSPLHLAIYKGNSEIVKLLLEYNANPDLCNPDNLSPLYLAICNGNSEIVKLLLEYNANPDLCNPDNLSPLYLAICNGNSEIVKLLLEYNANPDLCNPDNLSPLYLAICNGNSEIVKLLLEYNANPDLCNPDNLSPLHLAIGNGNSEIVKLLLEHNANPDLTNPDNLSHLHLAIINNDYNLVELLIKNGANIEAQNSSLQTPLFAAINQGNYKIVKLILNCGANFNITNEYSQVFLNIAKQSNNSGETSFDIDKSRIANLLIHYSETLEQAQSNPHRKVLKIAIEHDYAWIVKLLMKANVIIKEKDLALAKKHNSQAVGQVLLNYFKFFSQVGLISKTGLVGQLPLPDKIIDYIARIAQ